MNKYIRAGICLLYTELKFLVLKIKNGSNFKASLINICSPMSEMDISKHGVLQIGKRFKMRSNTHLRVRTNGRIEIGDDVSMNYGDMIVCYEKIIIGNNVQLSPNVLIYDHDHDFLAKDGLKKLLYKTSPVIIGSNVWIGANTVILRGTIIEDDCVIGAGCIVKGKVEKGTVMIQRRVNENLAY